MPIIPLIAEGASLDELAVNRLNTSAFIAAAPTIVTLIPRTRDGYDWSDGTARPGQIMRVIDQSSTTDPSGGPAPGAAKVTDGIEADVAQTDFFLLGEWDAEIAVHDWWTDSTGRQWEVLDMFPPNGYETRAVVAPRLEVAAIANATMRLERGSQVTGDYSEREDVATVIAGNFPAFVHEIVKGEDFDAAVAAQIQVGPIVADVGGGEVIPRADDRLVDIDTGETWVVTGVNRSRLPGGKILCVAERVGYLLADS